MEEVLTQLPSLGVAGLLFVMWWCERQERTKAANRLRETLSDASATAEINERLLEVIRANTEALTALREELRAFRQTEHEWLDRISRQLEALELG